VYRFVAELWLYSGDAPWHFLTLPAEVSDHIRDLTSTSRRAFGSVRVRVNVGRTTWSTSVFPDSVGRTYVLPVKKSVRVKEGIGVGDRVDVQLTVLDPAE
jgi:hypothetical protein